MAPIIHDTSCFIEILMLFEKNYETIRTSIIAKSSGVTPQQRLEQTETVSMMTLKHWDPFLLNVSKQRYSHFTYFNFFGWNSVLHTWLANQSWYVRELGIQRLALCMIDLIKDLFPYLLNFCVQVQKMSLCMREIAMFGHRIALWIARHNMDYDSSLNIYKARAILKLVCTRCWIVGANFYT
jgi:hypothetical protein